MEALRHEDEEEGAFRRVSKEFQEVSGCFVEISEGFREAFLLASYSVRGERVRGVTGELKMFQFQREFLGLHKPFKLFQMVLWAF